ncbi:MAG: hypothetical protein QUS35_12290 [bacterium]|nr:hypothetical protein [bacterium]
MGVAIDDRGHFVAVWSDSREGYDIRARRSYANGAPAASGVYLVRLEAGWRVRHSKVTLIRQRAGPRHSGDGLSAPPRRPAREKT